MNTGVYKKTFVITFFIGMTIFYLWYFVSTIANLFVQRRLTCVGFGGIQYCSLIEFIFALIIHSFVFILVIILPIVLVSLVTVYTILQIKNSKWKKQ